MSAPTSTRTRAVPDWAAALGAAAVSVVIAAVVLDLGSADLGEPLAYGGDANSAHMIVKGVLENGWYQENPDLGYPFGQDLRSYAFVAGDNLHIAVIKMLGVLGASPPVALNLFFLLGFALCAATAYLVLRAWGVTQSVAAGCAVLFSLLPYHFFHGATHLFISAYYSVPLVVYLCVETWRRNALLVGRPRRQMALVVALCVVVGSAHVYYAAFAVLLIGFAALVSAIGARSLRVAATLAAPAIVVLLVMGVNHLPNVVHSIGHDSNPKLERTISDSEDFALKPASMLLPVSGHRLAPLADLRDRYEQGTRGQVREGGPQAIGTLATLGVLGLLVVLFAGAVAGGRRLMSGVTGPLAATMTSALLLGTVGGGSILFALLVSPSLRAWARVSVLIGFCGLAAIAFGLDTLRTRFPMHRGATGLVLVAVVVVGVLDQTTAGMAPDHDSIQSSWRSDAAFVSSIERTLPDGAAVFELPYQPFPEPQITWVPDAAQPYDGVVPYLHSSTLRWSFGEIKSARADWQYNLMSGPARLVAPGAVAAGFQGLVLDRVSYTDPAPVEAAIRESIGNPTTTSPDRRWVFWDLRQVSAAEGARSAVLDPVRVDWNVGASAPKHGDQSIRLGTRRVAITIGNPGRAPRTVEFATGLEAASGSPADISVRWPDGVTESARLPAQVSHRFEVPPRGNAIVTFETTAPLVGLLPDIARPFALRFVNPSMADRRLLASNAALEPTVPATLNTPYAGE